MIYMKKSIFGALAVLTILFASCAGGKKVVANQSSEQSEITGNRWVLIELNGKEITGKLNNKEPFLDFMNDGTRYAASGGCNTMGGEYLFGGNGKITFKPGMSTMMACDDMETDKLLSEVFKNTNNYSLNADILSLNQGKKAPLAKFRKVDAQNNLAGTWTLDYIDGAGTTFEELYPNNKPTITFDPNSNKVTGNGGCNSFNSSAEVNGRNIKFSPIASTRMACQGNGEPLFFQTLQKVNVQSVNGDQLTLIVGDIAVMRFKKNK